MGGSNTVWHVVLRIVCLGILGSNLVFGGNNPPKVERLPDAGRSFSLSPAVHSAFPIPRVPFLEQQNPLRPRLHSRGPQFLDVIPSKQSQRSVAKLTNSLGPNIGPTLIVNDPQIYNKNNSALPYGLLGRSETAIASSSDGSVIVVGWNDPDGFLSTFAADGITGYAISTDSGMNFRDGGPLPPATFDGMTIIPRGDPWLDVAGLGQDTFYFANLASELSTLANIGVIVHRGIVRNGVMEWEAPSVVRPPGAGDFLDKESVVADWRPNESHRVYVAVTNFLGIGGAPTQIELYRSSDAGQTWQGPAVVREPDLLGQQGAVAVVGANGEVHVVWERGRFTDSCQVLFATSTDFGKTFGPPVMIARITGSALYPPVGYNRMRYNDFPRIALDRSAMHPGRLYVTYHDAGNNPPIHTDGVYARTSGDLWRRTGGVADGDIYLRYSDDGGLNWSEPKLVSSRLPGDKKNQFWPVVSVSNSGVVNVVYYENTEFQPQPIDTLATNISLGSGMVRRSSYQTLVDVVWAQSQDGGETFLPPARINETTSNWSIAECNMIPNFGDYIASVAAGQRVYTVWGQSHIYDVDPSPAVNQQFVPSVAFTIIDLTGERIKRRPREFSLEQNFPNPFNPVTAITYELPEERHVTLKIYNTLGEEIMTIVDTQRGAGRHIEMFNGESLPSGVYFYMLTADEFRSIQKMMLVR